MIILPDKNISRTKILLPVHKRQWMPPSHAQVKTVFGHEDRTYFWAIGKNRNKKIVWKGRFEDREDFDIFIHSILTGNIKYDKYVQKLSLPEWNTDLDTDIVYEFITQNVLTTAGSLQNYSVPADWNSLSNTVECVGAGGGGTVARSTLGCVSCGAGGGGYGKKNNVSLTPSSSVNYYVGARGNRAQISTSTVASGGAGEDTYFGASTYAGSSVGGTGGQPGESSTSPFTRSGGTGGTGKGDLSYSGGRGGNIAGASTFNARASGGGGAAGKNGDGNQGVDIGAAGTPTSTNGGSGDAGFGGSAGVSPGGAGGNGTEWGSVGSGGGGASRSGTGVTGGDGGNYGAGGGAAGGTSGTITSGYGNQGIIVIEYTPLSLVWTNMPMLGM